ncbi:MerR family transcriptional regulator [Yinghuangia soli]|uniref:MerR family transcriptional regulator n=1 Tax=Yinghuangia soli TaxID=2908204 RepID=A0AA41PU00_9ACTN|nr:MerR family transcriptional regulator [Yinghuangia soli]MCF2525848.1 MerR family transcriptional regulator [Yinghuangia soli]
MRIGELSRRTGVHAHQLRYYEAQGLLEADRRGNGYRDYDDDAVLRVKQIRHLLGAGLSSEDIAYLLPCATGEVPELVGCPELLAAMRTRLQRLEDQMARLAQSRGALMDYIAEAERIGGDAYPPFDGTEEAAPGIERVPVAARA